MTTQQEAAPQVAGRIPSFDVQHRLRLARETSGYDQRQREFAEMIGISHATLTNYEKGHTRPRRIVLMAWAMATGVPVSWLESGQADEGDRHRPGGLPQLDSNQQPADYQSARALATVTDLDARRRPAA